MLQPQFQSAAESDQWLHERNRFTVLEYIYHSTGGDCSAVMKCGTLADELRLAREEVFRILHELEFRGFLAYMGGGPRVRLTPRATEFLTRDAGRRRSIRDEVRKH